MVTYRELMDARPQAYERASATWSTWADVIDDHAKDVRKDIVDYAFGGDVWVDKAADAGRDYVEGLLRGMRVSFDGLEEVGHALRWFGREVAEAQFEAKRHLQRAEDAGLVVDYQTAAITVPPIEYGKNKPIKTPDQAAEVKSKLETFAAECEAGVRGAVRKATDADESAARRLGEHSRPIPTLRQLNRRVDRMQELAHDAAALAGESLEGALSEEEMERLHDLMSQYGDDPAFAKAFLEDLGAKNALRFGTRLAVFGSDGEDTELAAALQEDLAHTLATGTNESNWRHVDDGWVDELKTAGRAPLGDRHTQYGTIYGYQALGALLDDATFSTGFLTEVGRDMYEFDVAHAEDIPPLWTRAAGPSGALPSGFDLDLGDEDEAGFDPISGLMEGLARNPEASREFFNTDFDLPDSAPDSAANPVDYLMTDRQWMEDLPHGARAGPDYQPPGTSNLGEALEAATLRGIDTGDAAKSAARIMENVVHSAATDEKVMNAPFDAVDVVPDNMRDSMAEMFKGYIGDVNSTFGAEKIKDEVFNNPAIPGEELAHAWFNEDELMRVLADTAKNEDAYETLYDAQRAYTAMAMRADALGIDKNGLAHPLSEIPEGYERDSVVEARRDNVLATATNSGQVFAALEFGQGRDILAQSTADEGWVTAAAKAGSFAVGRAADAIPVLRPAGPLIQAGADTVVDEVVTGMHQDNLAQANYQAGQSYANSKDFIQGVTNASIYRYGLFEHGQEPPVTLMDPATGHYRLPDALHGADATAYNNWVVGKGQGVLDPTQSAGKAFTAGLVDARNTLQRFGSGG